MIAFAAEVPEGTPAQSSQPLEKTQLASDSDTKNRFLDTLGGTFETLRNAFDPKSVAAIRTLLDRRGNTVKNDPVAIGSERMRIALKDLPGDLVDLARQAAGLLTVGDKQSSLTELLQKINQRVSSESDSDRGRTFAESVASFLNANLSGVELSVKDGKLDLPAQAAVSTESADRKESPKEAFRKRLAELFDKVLSMFENPQAVEAIAPNALLGGRLNVAAQRFDILEGRRKIENSRGAIDAVIGNPQFVAEYQRQPEVPQTAQQFQAECVRCQGRAVERVQQQTDLLKEQWEFLNAVEVSLPQYLSAAGLGHITASINRTAGRIEFRGMRGAADSALLKQAVYERMPPGISATMPTGDSGQTYATLRLNQPCIQGLKLLLGNSIKTPGQIAQETVASLNLPAGSQVDNMYLNLPAAGAGGNFGVPESLLRAKEDFNAIPAPIDIPYSEGPIIISFSYGLADQNPVLENIPGNRGAGNSGFMIENREGGGKLNENMQRLPFNERTVERYKQPDYKRVALENMGIRLSDARQGGIAYGTRIEFTRPLPAGEWVKINGQTYSGRSAQTGRGSPRLA